MSRSLISRLLVVAGVVWASGLALGFRALWVYSATPGPAPSVRAGAAWPADSRISRVDRKSVV